MSAGLPGVGLSGVFFIVCALLMLPREIVRTIRGRSSWRSWSDTLRHVAIAMAMIAGLELAYAVMHLAVEHLFGTPSHRVRLVPWVPVASTLGVIALLVLGAKLFQVVRQRRTRIGSARSAGAREPSTRPHLSRLPNQG